MLYILDFYLDCSFIVNYIEESFRKSYIEINKLLTFIRMFKNLVTLKNYFLLRDFSLVFIKENK